MAKTQKKTEPEHPRELFVYLGKFLGDGGAVKIMLLPTTEESAKNGKRVPFDYEHEHVCIFSSSAGKYFKAVGAVYSVETPKDGTIIPASAKYERHWGSPKGTWGSNNDQVVEWQARAEARSAEIQVHRDHKAAERFDAVKARLEPIKRAYRRMPAAQRAIFLARVVKFITNND